MRRRSLLVLVGMIPTSGCLTDGTDASPTSSDDTTENLDGTAGDESEPATEGFPTLAAEGEDVSVDRHDLRASVEIVEQPTDERPGRLRIALENYGTEVISVQEGGAIPFSGLWSPQWPEGDESIRLYLYPGDRDHVYVYPPEDGAADEAPEEPVDGCWALDGIGMDSIGVTRTLQPDREVSETYEVYANSHVAECFPSGDHRFETGWSVWAGGRRSVDAEREQVSWGFTLSIEY